MIDKLTEIGRCYDMEMNVEKKQKWWEFEDSHPQ